MKKTIKALKVPAIVLLLITSFIACDKDFYVLDSDVLGKDNANFFTDTDSLIPIVSYNKKLDSLQINNLPSNLLGVYNDPEFGLSTASVVTQILPLTFNPDFGENPTIESVILNIPYFSTISGIDEEGNSEYTLDSIYGNSPFKLSIYQNNYFLRDLNPDPSIGGQQNYYSNANTGNTTDNLALTNKLSINFDSNELLGSKIFETADFSPSNLPIIITTGEGDDQVESRLAPALRVELDETFWNNTIIEKQGSSELSNASNFYSYFRSLYFKAEGNGGDGSMILLNFASQDANITINYTSGTTDDRTEASYIFNFTGNRINTFINNYSLTLEDGDKELGDEKLYLKGGGSMAVVNLFDGMVEYTDEDNNTSVIPSLEAFKKTFRAVDDEGEFITESTTGDYVLKQLINEAHLLIYEDETSTTTIEDYHKYDRIYAYDVKNSTPTIDYSLDFTENVASPVNSKVIHLSQRQEDDKGFFNYKIRLTEHLNNILQKDSTNTKIGLVLSTNVNLIGNSEILQNSNSGNEEDIKVTSVPSASIITPKGTILHGSNENVPENKKMKLKIFFTDPK